MSKSITTQNFRRQVAIEAARLMLEHGIDDFLMAKRKAAERLGFKDSSALPTNQEIEQALLETRRLFSANVSENELKLMRSAALELMQFLHLFRPRLVGAALTGALTGVSAIELHLFTDTTEHVAMQLMDSRIEYRLVERRMRFGNEEFRSVPVYCFEAETFDVDAFVFSLDGERQPPLSPVDGKPMARLSDRSVSELIATNDSNDAVDRFFAS